MRHIDLQGLPQRGLPLLLRRQRLRHTSRLAQNAIALGPIVQPICTVTLIAVKDIGNLLRQLVTLASFWVVRHVVQQGRDYLQVLENFDQPADAIAVMTKQEIFSQPKPEFAGTRLQCIQSDILDLKVLPETPEDVADDGSVQWVQSHSVQRELEILHDHLWQWFDQHKDWKPSDVMVMVPDMAEFSASVEAVFGRFPVNHPRHIPFSVADTTPRQSPMVLALELLLSLPQSRVTLAEGLSLLEVASIRKRFELDEREVRVLLHWLQWA